MVDNVHNIEVNVDLNTSKIDDKVIDSLHKVDKVVAKLDDSVIIVQILLCALILLIFVTTWIKVSKCVYRFKENSRNRRNMRNLEVQRV